MQPARTTSPTSKGKRPDTPNLNTNTTERVDTPQTANTPYTALFDRTNSQSLDTPASTAPPSAIEDMEKRLRFAALPNDNTDERVKATARDLQSTQALVGTVQNLLKTLAPRVQRQAESLPAIKAQQSIAALVKSWDEQLSRQTKEIENMQKRIDAALTKDGVLAKLNGDMRQRIEEKVKQQVAKKVKAQMDDEISVEQRNEVAAYKRQIVEVEHSLRNADARRRNSLLGAASSKLSDAKIWPVLPDLSPDADSLPPIPAGFPADIPMLMKMPDKELAQLLGDEGYGFDGKAVLAGLKKTVGQATKSEGYKQRRRVAMLNYFLQYLGVPFRTTCTANDVQAGRIIVTRTRRC
ncbi:hypothetical protein GGF50DRAFT_105831 [Schizophyllum commune]